MKILLIDDHVSFCEGLISAISSQREDLQVESVSDTKLLPQLLLEESDYDLFIIDLMMPGLGGVELIRQLNQNRSLTPVIVMSSVVEPVIIKQVFELGAVGYLPKSYSVFEIIDALDQCSSGGMHLPPEAKVNPIPLAPTTPDETNTITLTKRQLEIVSLMDLGYSNLQIADDLNITESTVKSHVNQIFRLLGVRNRVSCLKALSAQGTLG